MSDSTLSYLLGMVSQSCCLTTVMMIIIIKVYIECIMLSGETDISAYTHSHTGTRTRDYTRLTLQPT